MRIHVPFALSLLITACGGDNTGPDGNGGCTDIVNTSAVIYKTTHAEPTPAPTGGAITDGTYVLTAMDKWNGHSGDTWHRETWRFVAGKVDVSSIEKDKPSETRASGTFSTSGTALSIHFTCPQDMQRTVQYSATATTLTTFNAGDPNETHTFTKQ